MAAAESGALPVDWGADGSGIRWRQEIATEGLSSPIVGVSTIFLTGEVRHGKETELEVMGLDLESGDLRWKTSVFRRRRERFPHRSVRNSPAGPTPVTDGRFLYAYFGSHLAALDLAGRVVWLEEIDPSYMAEAYYGAGSSLVLAADQLIVLRDRESAQDDGVTGWIAAFNKETGQRSWRVEWNDTCCSYTTPIVVERASGLQVLVSLAGRLVAFDPATGEQLWSRQQDINQPVASPATEGDIVCVASGAHNVRQTNCWRFGREDGEPGPEPLWTDQRGVPATASPLMYNGFLFLLHERGFLRSYAPDTGELIWSKRLATGQYHASLVGGDGKIYAVARAGRVTVMAAAQKFEQLAENDLPDSGVVASPAFAGGCLLVRTKSSLLCIDGAGGKAPGGTEAAAAGAGSAAATLADDTLDST